MSGARIGVVEDHALLVEGLRALFEAEPNLDLVATAGSVAELLGQSADLDLVLLDLRLGDGTRPGDNVRRLRACGAEVLAYTSGENPALVREAARADVIGMISKSEPPSVLVAAVRAALRGDVVASTDWAAAIDADTELAAVALTPRETQVLRLYASGEKAERVAHQLGISRDTVLDHVRNIRAKYARASRPAHTKVDLYRRAVEDGVLPDPR